MKKKKKIIYGAFRMRNKMKYKFFLKNILKFLTLRHAHVLIHGHSAYIYVYAILVIILHCYIVITPVRYSDIFSIFFLILVHAELPTHAK